MNSGQEPDVFLTPDPSLRYTSTPAKSNNTSISCENGFQAKSTTCTSINLSRNTSNSIMKIKWLSIIYGVIKQREAPTQQKGKVMVQSKMA